MTLSVLPLLLAVAGSMPTQVAVPTPKPEIGATPRIQEAPITVKVLVINFDPIVPGDERLSKHCGWNKPRELADGYIADVKTSSNNFIQYQIVEWRDVDAFPVKLDGFRYTVDAYLSAWKKETPWHEPDGTDYEATIVQYGIDKAIDSGKADEVWWFGAPYMGFWESAMAGPRAFYINGGVYEKVRTTRPFAIMGFNYERGVAEMLHDLCHRTESTMSRIYGGWEVDKLTTNWARFAANFTQSKGVAAVGTCHWPPNAEKDYDYANPRVVRSSADDWLNYPKLSGRTRNVSCETWGGPDYHRNYMKWWFAHLPRAPGVNEDGRLNNWWRYVFEFDKYTENGQKRG